MGLFNFDRYMKPGKGVEKDEKPKPAFIRFFIILWRKRNHLLGINSIYVLFSILIPIIAVLAFAGCAALYDAFNPDAGFGKLISENEAASTIYFKVMIFFAVFFTSIPVFSAGPFQAGFTYILKSFYKEEPVFLFHDFISKAKSNLSLSIKTCLINLFAGLAIMLNATAYFVIADPSNPRYNTLPWFFLFLVAAVTIFFSVLLTMMSMFLYPMMVTFNVNLRQLYKNTFILCMVKWLPTIGIILLDALVIGLPIFILPVHNYLVFVFSIIFYVAITPGIINLINMFYVYPILKKYLIDNVNADKSGGNVNEESSADELPKKTGGRFENGMWVED